MEKSYFRTLAEHFTSVPYEAFGEETMHQVRRSLVNYLGGSIYTASNQCCRELLAMIRTTDPAGGRANVWACTEKVHASTAAFSNACRLSSLELNDGTRASAHPGIYVWSAVLATYQQYGGSVRDVVRAVVFGYDVVSRMAMRSIDRIIELGLHNPGFVGGLGAVAAAGLLRGLNVDQLCNAFGMTAALLPLCPFCSFIEGSDSKDLYGGWGVHLAMFAVDAAARGLTGPDTVLKGMKSLEKIFQEDLAPKVEIGQPYCIEWLSIKQYPACFAVNPAVNAVFQLQRKHSFDPEQIESVFVDTYPYSYDLNHGVGRNPNTTSGRLSLYYTVAVALLDGPLGPDAFSEEKLHDPRYEALRARIHTGRHNEYGDGPHGIRGCIVSLHMTDGSVLCEEYDASATKTVFSDSMLFDRFCELTACALSPAEQRALYDFAMSVDTMDDLSPLLNQLVTLPTAK